MLCHHAARVGDYRSPDFDIAGALAENTANLHSVLEALSSRRSKRRRADGQRIRAERRRRRKAAVAFSPYGLSKGLTAEVVRHRCQEFGLYYGKFVIPNPFGPLEEPRFCAYLIRSWRKGEVARLNTPDYVRDNIHVSLLAAAYAKFVGEMAVGKGRDKLNPSGYVESQGTFAYRVAAAMRPRLTMPCRIEFAVQTDFSEPIMRVNFDSAARYVGDWNESAAWDQAAEGYRG